MAIMIRKKSTNQDKKIRLLEVLEGVCNEKNFLLSGTL